MYSKAKEEDADMLICDYFHNDEFRQIINLQTPSSLNQWNVLEDIIAGKLYGYCWNKLIKNEVYKKYGVKFPTEFYGCEDQYGMCQMLKHDIKISYLPKAFCHYVYVQGSLSRHYDEKTFQNDVLARDMFTNLLQGTPSEKSVYKEKTATIFVRAFLFGKKYYNSKEFKVKFSEYYPSVSSSGVNKILYKMSYNGYYSFSRNIFQVLFDVKQFLKKIHKKNEIVI